MKRILLVTALAATMAIAAVAAPAGAGLGLTDLTVAPDSGRPGDAFTVSGGGCTFAQDNVDGEAAGQSTGGRFARRGIGPFAEVDVEVAFPTPTATTTTPNSQGDWSVGFVVPPGTPPGVYEVAAVCIPNFPEELRSFGRARGGPIPIPYESSSYTVVADPGTPAAPLAPAAPVPGTPRFTG